MLNGTAVRWVALTTCVLLIILVPFFLFETQIETWTESFLQAASDQIGLVAVMLTSLLSSDILLPIPSSLVSTAAGYFLGFVGGMLASAAGMTISCMLGYWLAARFGRPLAGKFVGHDELGRLERLYQRFGDWVIVISRPVPVLAEASVLFAGLGRMSFPRFLLLATLSNVGISAVYAAVGAFSATANSFLLAFAGAILVPLVAMLVTRKWK
jgi:uncharacterized membrane protein YdjX (TVP38/TMEM64 family)